jgi:carbamoyltransferase
MTQVIGINRTSDASFCLLDGADNAVLLRKERLNREKHAWGKIGDLALYRLALSNKLERIQAIVQCFSSDTERANIRAYESELRTGLSIGPALEILEISHHFAHAYSGFFPSGFPEAAILIADNRGSPQDLVDRSPRVANGRGEGPLEVISAFEAGAGRINAIARQWWSRDDRAPAGLGMFYSRASGAVFGRYDREGVLMGLASLGDASRFCLPPLEVSGIEVRIPEKWINIFENADRFSFLRNGQGYLADCADLAAATQEAFEVALIKVARHLRLISGLRRLVYAGGCALNCSANSRLLAEGGFDDVFIPPACDDGGTSLGCALFGLQTLGVDLSPAHWRSDYLGPQWELRETDVQAGAKSRGLGCSRPDNLSEIVAKYLDGGDVVALFQGRSESGARALGNRSILADPRFELMRTFVNREVKGREWYRPLAPVTRAEDASRCFDMFGPSPYMQIKFDVRPHWKRRLAAISHVDGSARVQTVTSTQNPFLYELLGSFAVRTGVSVLLNTSFNGKGEPIVETMDDALDSLCRLPIRWLVAPPFIIGPGPNAKSPLAD